MISLQNQMLKLRSKQRAQEEESQNNDFRSSSIVEETVLPPVLPEPNLILSNNLNIQKQESEVTPVEMKINLAKPIRKDSVIEDFSSTPPEKINEFANVTNTIPPKPINEIPIQPKIEVNNVPKTQFIPESNQFPVASNDELDSLTNKLFSFQYKAENIMRKLGE